MHVGLITYQTGHLKTWQLLQKLRTKSFEVTVFAFPFRLRKQKQVHFQDRPNQLIDIDLVSCCSRLGFRYVEVGGWDDEFAVCLDSPSESKKPDAFLTCIAKIIPRPFLTDRIVVNAHPGLLPWNRGLDAFKWSIVNAWPVGISLHVIDERIDRGTLLHRLRVPIFEDDKLRDVADRAYSLECDLQANFDYYLPELAKEQTVSDEFGLSKSRVSASVDRRLPEIFEENKSLLIQLSDETVCSLDTGHSARGA